MNTASICVVLIVYIVCYTQPIHTADFVRVHVEYKKKKKKNKKNARSLKKYGNADLSFLPTFRCRLIII